MTFIYQKELNWRCLGITNLFSEIGIYCIYDRIRIWKICSDRSRQAASAPNPSSLAAPAPITSIFGSFGLKSIHFGGFGSKYLHFGSFGFKSLNFGIFGSNSLHFSRFGFLLIPPFWRLRLKSLHFLRLRLSKHDQYDSTSLSLNFVMTIAGAGAVTSMERIRVRNTEETCQSPIYFTDNLVFLYKKKTEFLGDYSKCINLFFYTVCVWLGCKLSVHTWTKIAQFNFENDVWCCYLFLRI